MDVLAIATQKGGSGKTTVAVNLAVAAHQAGRRVVALDLDPQGSLAAWATRRAADDPVVDHLGLERVGQLPEILAALREPAAVADAYAADAWAFGCLVAAVLTGERPWDGVDDVAAAVLDGAKSPALPEASVAPGLVEIARDCLSRTASARPALAMVVNRVERLLVEDIMRGATAEERLARVQAAVTEEEKNDASAYARAWAACEGASGAAAVASLLPRGNSRRVLSTLVEQDPFAQASSRASRAAS